MTIAAPGTVQSDIDVNSRKTLTAIIYLAVVGPCVFILQPGFVQGLVQYLGMTEQQAGYIAAAEVFGLATMAVTLIFVANRISWRKLMLFFLAVCVTGNLVSIGIADATTLGIVRFITGLGSGGIASLTFTMAGLTARADRNFGFIIVWVLTYGAAGLFAMPAAYHLVGMNGVLVFFALFCALGFVFVRNLPDSGEAHTSGIAERHYSAMIKNLSLLAILVYNTAIGIVWAYLFLVGLEGGMPEQSVANALTISQFFGIAGAFGAVIFEARLGRLLPLAVGILGGALSVYLLVDQPSAMDYWIGVCAFNLLWNLSMPYLLGVLAEFDHLGRSVVHGVSMQFIGFAIGPFAAAKLLSMGGYDLVNGTAAVLFVASLFIILPGLLAQHRRQVRAS